MVIAEMQPREEERVAPDPQTEPLAEPNRSRLHRAPAPITVWLAWRLATITVDCISADFIAATLPGELAKTGETAPPPRMTEATNNALKIFKFFSFTGTRVNAAAIESTKQTASGS